MLILFIKQSYQREVSIQKEPPEVFCKKEALKNFANFTCKNTCVGVSFDRSSHWRCSVGKVFLKILQISQENTCVGMLLTKFVKSFIKKRLQHRCFPVNFAKFLRTHFFNELLWGLLLKVFSSYINKCFHFCFQLLIF